MADSQAFDFTCNHLEERTSLDRLAVRGTVRIALKQAGLEARSVTPEQLVVVAERVLPGELASRGIEGAEAVCTEIVRALQAMGSGESTGETPDAVFKRLGGA